MLIASVFCSLAVVAGGLAGGTWAIAPILAAGAFAAGMMVAFGPAQADLGHDRAGYPDRVFGEAFAFRAGARFRLLALGGGLFQTALVLALWPLRRHTPERRALSALYLELARAADAPSPVTEAPPASRESTEAQQALAALDARDSLDAERYLALLSQAERIRLALLLLARLRIRIGRETGTRKGDRHFGSLCRPGVAGVSVRGRARWAVERPPTRCPNWLSKWRTSPKRSAARAVGLVLLQNVTFRCT